MKSNIAVLLSLGLGGLLVSDVGTSQENTNPYHKDPSPNEICHECYRENRKEFQAFLDRIESFNGTPADDLEKVDDFYISRVGIMIHEECLEKEFEFIDDDPMQEFEQMITDSVIRGLSCMAKGDEFFRNQKGWDLTSAFNHMPNFLNLLKNRDSANQDPIVVIVNNDVRSTIDLNCDAYSKLPNSERFPIHNSCEVIKSIPRLPKIFCEHDSLGDLNDFNKQNVRSFSSASARSTVPDTSRPIVKNHQNKTKIYTGPAIFLNAGNVKSWRKEFIQSTIFHEMFHLLGYEHEQWDEGDNFIARGHNDYALACEAACFYDEYIDQMASHGIGKESAGKFCFNNSYDADSYTKASGVKKALIRRNMNLDR